MLMSEYGFYYETSDFEYDKFSLMKLNVFNTENQIHIQLTGGYHFL